MGDLVTATIDGFKTPQGAHSPTFTAPPLDGSMYIPEWVDWHMERSPNHSYALLVAEDGEDNVTITWKEVGRAVHRLGSRFLRTISRIEQSSTGAPGTIAVLLQADQLVYTTIVMALVRAGFEPFCISPRNSLPALVHLINKTSCAFVIGSITHGSDKRSALEEKTADLLEACPALKMVEVPTLSEIYPRLSTRPIEPYNAEMDIADTELIPAVRSLPSYRQDDSNRPVYMMHSSGSTSFPKPIPLPTQSVLAWARWAWYGDIDICSSVWAAMSLPVFHAAGIGLSVALTSSCGLTLASKVPSDSPTQLTPEGILEVAKRSRADYVVAVPSVCEAWSASPEAVDYLASMKGGLIYTGGPMTEERGEGLVEGGVNLQNLYGSTETALISKGINSHQLKGTADWQYFQFSPEIEYELETEGADLHRLVILSSPSHRISGPSYLEPPTRFDTNDLLEEHPVHKGFWKVIGRADDQIIMSNGEKTNPGPLESIIAGHPLLQTAVMFGRSRSQVGVAVEPAVALDIKNDVEVANFRNAIWPVIEKANAFAPTHSRIFKEMILVVDPHRKPFARTGKDTLARNAVLKQYAEEIEAIYAAAERPLAAEWAKPPQTWDSISIHNFTAKVVNGVMKDSTAKQDSVDDSRDLFEQGCDSLQATYIRNAIINALQQATRQGPNAGTAYMNVPQNLVFAHPTVCQLVDFITRLVSGDSSEDSSGQKAIDKRVSTMLDMVQKYSTGFTEHPAAYNPSVMCGEVVLVTGTTGTLGSYILQRLLLDPKVVRVYAFNRRTGKHILARQEDAFRDRGVDVALLKSAKLRLLEGNATASDLGLDARLIEEIISSVTTIVHNAWRLDFNLSLSSFEVHVKATRTLVDIALLSPRGKPQFIFTSSIGTISNWDRIMTVPEEPLADPQIAFGNGYGESKWVAERVLVQAAESRGLRATVWRVGQLTGSTVNGMWNTTDWVPIMAKAGKVMGCLPSSPSANVSWLPTDKAAQTIIDVLHRNAQAGANLNYLHLVHPKPTKWDIVLGSVANRLKVRLVPFSDWFTMLEAAAKDDTSEIERNPAIKLLDFFRAGAASHSSANTDAEIPSEGMGFPTLQTMKAVQASATLARLDPLTEDDVEKWMAYWESHGLFA